MEVKEVVPVKDPVILSLMVPNMTSDIVHGTVSEIAPGVVSESVLELFPEHSQIEAETKLYAGVKIVSKVEM